MEEHLVKLSTSIADETISDTLLRVAEVYNRRLWHQLTKLLLQVVPNAFFDQGTDLLQLYDPYLRDVERKLKPFSLAQIIGHVARQYTDVDTAISFLKSKESVLGDDVDAQAYNKCTIAHMLVNKEETAQAKDLLAGVKDTLDAQLTTEALVFSKYYYVASIYHKSQVDASSFAKAAISYLAYTSLESISLENQRTLARDIALAALVATDLYSFGEVLAQPAFDSLKGTDDEFLWHMVSAFNVGDIAAYQALLSKHEDAIRAHATLADNLQRLGEKIAILSLIELVFSRPTHQRTISFADIAAKAQLEAGDVELLVMKALSLGLVRGEIDEVEQTCFFTWVQPRVLSLAQIGVMAAKLQGWQERVQSTVGLVEGQAGDLLED